MEPIEERKVKEKELHDHLRGNLADSPYYTSNLKFYSVTQSSRAYVKNWLAKRCKGKKVLDYCGGNGAFTIWLTEEGAEAFGIDISPVSIDNARREANRQGVSNKVHFFVMDAENMEFESDYFDYAVANGVLHHLDLRKAYPELARVLKPSGAVICTEPLKYNPLSQLYRRMTPHLRTEWEIKHILGKDNIEMARTYFYDVHIENFFHLTTLTAVPFRNLSIFDSTLALLEGLDNILLKLPILKWLSWQVIFVLSQPKK